MAIKEIQQGTVKIFESDIEGMLIRQIGSNNEPSRGISMSKDNPLSIDDFEEITREEYDSAIEYEKKLKDYEVLVDQLIRKKYSISNELSILRQRDTKPQEYEQYNTFAEECKLKAKEMLGL